MSNQVDTGEVFAATKRGWMNAPVGAMVDREECQHNHVTVSRSVDGGVVSSTAVGNGGNTVLYCFDCDEVWWEPLSNIKGSAWEGK